MYSLKPLTACNFRKFLFSSSETQLAKTALKGVMCFCFSFVQFMVNRFKLFQSVTQNANSNVTFSIPSVAKFPDLSFFFQLISRLKEVYHIIRQQSRTKQYIKPQHLVFFCRENQVNSLMV